MSEHVIALDPGGRSGWASARMSEDQLELTGGGVLRQDYMARWFAEKQAVFFTHNDPRRLQAYDKLFDVMVYETWYPREENGSMEWIKGDPLLTPQHIGQLRLVADMSGTKIVDQHPTDKPMAVATMPANLHDVDKWSNEQHDQDARMHLWLYFWRNWFTTKVDPEDTVTT